MWIYRFDIYKYYTYMSYSHIVLIVHQESRLCFEFTFGYELYVCDRHRPPEAFEESSASSASSASSGCGGTSQLSGLSSCSAALGASQGERSLGISREYDSSS